MDTLTMCFLAVGCALMLLYIIVKRTLKDAALSFLIPLSSMSIVAGIKIIQFAVDNSELATLAKANGIEIYTIALGGVAIILFSLIALFISFFKPTP